VVANLAAGTPVQGQGVTLGSIVVFAAGADGDAEPLRVIRGPATGLRLPDGLIVDRRGRIYVTNYPGAINDDTVRIFAPDADGDAAPERVIGGPHTGLDWPVGLALDREERLYVGNGGRVTRDPGPGITVYEAGAAGDATPIRTIVGGLQSGEEMWPHRLTFGRRDSLFVRTMAVLAVYAPGVTEASVPARLIYENVPRGPGRPFRTVRSPQRFVLDPYDSMYVITGDTVMVYAPGYSAHEPEVRRIAGPHTGIHSPQDIALDDRGWLYLVDYDSSLVRVFAPGATGDVAPSRTIGGPTTRLFLPGTIALDRKRRVYVANLEFRGPLIKLRR
jgi:hypothetical protein